MLAIPISVVIGGPLSGWLMTLPNVLHWPGWRWMFLLEGLPTLAMGAIAYLLLADRPGEAHWLDAAEQRWLEEQLRREQADTAAPSDRAASWSFVLARGQVWRVAAVWFSLLLGSNGILFWLPQVLKQFSGRGELAVGVMSTVPWFGLALGLVGNAWHSDRTQERTTWGSACWSAASRWPPPPPWARRPSPWCCCSSPAAASVPRRARSGPSPAICGAA
jgi:ACS family tartrate transporter-like MFS transporter